MLGNPASRLWEAQSLERTGRMSKGTMRYPREVRERAVRMVLEHQADYVSQWKAIESIARKFGMAPETLRRWVRQVEIDDGARDRGPTTTLPDPTLSISRRSRQASKLADRVENVKSHGATTARMPVGTRQEQTPPPRPPETTRRAKPRRLTRRCRAATSRRKTQRRPTLSVGSHRVAVGTPFRRI